MGRKLPGRFGWKAAQTLQSILINDPPGQGNLSSRVLLGLHEDRRSMPGKGRREWCTRESEPRRDHARFLSVHGRRMAPHRVARPTARGVGRGTFDRL